MPSLAKTSESASLSPVALHSGIHPALIPTPSLDQLAERGIKYNRFHTTAICGPSRAALLTGRNHHDTGNGFLMEWATGFPNYSTMIPRDTVTVAEVLRDNGYTTWWFGKNHNTPDWETSVAGPFDRWPTGLGFDYFYGFNAGETHQYYPVIFENTMPVEPDKTPEQGYHFMTDMTDKAIARMQYFKSVAPKKPFFMYFAPGAMHAPHHVTAEWRDQFRGKFAMGWEEYRKQVFQRQLDMGIIPPGTKLTPRPDWVPAWEALSAEQMALYTRLMENFAGYFAFTDHEVGRLLEAVYALPDADNTLIIYITGDNGASSEGGPDGTLNEIKMLNGQSTTIEETLARIDEIGEPQTEPHYPVGWAWAGNTPFQWVKQVASHLGGTRVGMVASWPARLAPDHQVRDQFLHLVDVVPTLLEASGIVMPESVNGIAQKPLAGQSFLASFTDPAAPARTEQYFEILSNRSIYFEGWKADAQHTLPWRQDLAPGNWEQDRWELYNLAEDFSEANDLAGEMPEKLAAMKERFDAAAERYHVYPLDDRGAARLLLPKPPPPGSDPKTTTYTFYAGATRLPENAAPQMKNRSFSLTAEVETAGAETEGVIMAFGGVAAGSSSTSTRASRSSTTTGSMRSATWWRPTLRSPAVRRRSVSTSTMTGAVQARAGRPRSSSTTRRPRRAGSRRPSPGGSESTPSGSARTAASRSPSTTPHPSPSPGGSTRCRSSSNDGAPAIRRPVACEPRCGKAMVAAVALLPRGCGGTDTRTRRHRNRGDAAMPSVRRRGTGAGRVNRSATGRSLDVRGRALSVGDLARRQREVRGVEADVDVPFSDALKDLSFGAMLLVDARRGRFGIAANGVFTRVSPEDEVGPIEIDVTTDLAQLGIGPYYRAVEWQYGETASGRPRRLMWNLAVPASTISGSSSRWQGART